MDTAASSIRPGRAGPQKDMLGVSVRRAEVAVAPVTFGAGRETVPGERRVALVPGSVGPAAGAPVTASAAFARSVLALLDHLLPHGLLPAGPADPALAHPWW
ncbi:hypothetical protein GCM10010430_63640 [Kitasatospora cystarginea]|uniref:Uncharacterized protein n=1 Tax=Kitasatospora cystarginea TaxID=58350 RepID=A0ABN3ESA2_9ACTN